MTLQELKTEIRKYQYFEDEGVIDVALASIVATRLKLGFPIWLIIIGISSGGKSQILRPLSLTDTKYIHRIDDLTENSFLSGMGGKDKMSLLQRIGSSGILVMSDLTVLFSKNSEAKAAILSQFRMIYDGEMTKFSGSRDKAISWKGALGVLAGSTPSIYRHFEEAADMGERFIYYRMKPFNYRSSAELAQTRTLIGKELDEKLGGLYEEYLKDTVKAFVEKVVTLSPEENKKIIDIAIFAEKIRTSTHMDKRETDIDDIPITASPARVTLQLTALAKGLAVIRGGSLSPEDIETLEWCGYSLGSERKRRCLGVLAKAPYGAGVRTQVIGDAIGLSTSMANKILQGMASIGVLKRTGDESSLYWHIMDKNDYETVRRVEKISGTEMFGSRALSEEERDQIDMAQNLELDNFGAGVITA